MPGRRRRLLHTEFAALLRRSSTSQAAFARLCDVTTKAVNNWCRGRQPPPRWAWALAVALTTTPADRLVVPPRFAWHETLGLGEPPFTKARAAKARGHMAKLYHPDRGGDNEAMQRINAAFDEARRKLADA
jgi:DNA-binding XRE family transcriptional regulator